MKDKFVLLVILLVLALSSAACAAGEATRGPDGATPMPTSSPANNAVTTEAGEDTITPTVTAESVSPTQGLEGAAVIPQTGPGDAGVPDDLDEVMRVLNETGAALELGDVVEQDYLSVPGQVLMIDGEEVQIYTFSSAGELETQAAQLPVAADPEAEPQFYKMGSMLIRYAGRDSGVRDLLEDVLGAHAAGE